MFPCEQCGRERFIIRGMCEDCAPALHDKQAAWVGFMSEAEEEDRAKTGRAALADWYGFERFLEEKLIREPNAAAALDLRPDTEVNSESY